jgi:UDP-glucose 4-epimerase
MNVLVTGGAGYVGSVVSEELLKIGHRVIVVDNLQQGHRQAVLPEAEFMQADIGDDRSLEMLFDGHQIDAVMHMAAETVISFSMSDPKRYFNNNIINGINLLNTMLRHNVKNLIFSSSAAVYGEPDSDIIDEDHRKSPINSYGESKLLFERVLHWYGKAYGLNHISLRYFNAAGASQRLGECHDPETHLIPNVLKAAYTKDSPVTIFGTDYSTTDGSCIRDYIHVIDIAQAHILALERADSLTGRAYNLGNSQGYSVFEVIAGAEKVTKSKIRTQVSSRRAGDPAVLVASSERAQNELRWKPKFPDLESIVGSAWHWLEEHPDGYRNSVVES